jgi:predicted nucleic acid-binding protein
MKLPIRPRPTGARRESRSPLRIDHDAASLAVSRLSELASTYRLTVYDAAYLELAQRRQLILGCKDGPLRAAAEQTGVRV